MQSSKAESVPVLLHGSTFITVGDVIYRNYFFCYVLKRDPEN
ncbi:hypothetical protein LEP1GSC132_3770 [Leptospira kirschneri str. 200803703]|uniref:Uncharacterized protein n=1 Tax=Leptospira kirschneri str. 200802841 TaxID=1193047 RepID=A0A828YB66_9LEPT|nr:hypothetical protein [Leptospira kirschneri]EKP04434.1 hypothetical protein LEP1GSC018_0208 [Leptospira kirschneri str. 2008720114]EKQ83739.1 hypothetical protein LEP1GSC064_0930 [Leptospira kirschneri serovar Grippotyphosa str. Moskva]EKR08811.1 hypothetical protein LEP1GSC122_1387 [Leptospira kirschneri serovar Valbuzzi str. 200702274]EMN26289.1 hypothetical protein LEP1GSC065_0997 [Leptospira kirschneri serovar Sokoine str. RM1]EMO69093.1 hypothetical protein LEP1GSC132_3770 [Leptospira 